MNDWADASAKIFKIFPPDGAVVVSNLADKVT